MVVNRARRFVVAFVFFFSVTNYIVQLRHQPAGANKAI